MAIAIKLKDYLESAGIEFDVLYHQHTGSSNETVRTVKITPSQLAKAVMLEDEAGYLMAVIPSDNRVDIGALHRYLGRQIGLATEDELPALFADCAPGAVPAIGQAYGLEVVVDDALDQEEDIYFEGGSHVDLVHMDGGDFHDLMASSEHGTFSRH